MPQTSSPPGLTTQATNKAIVLDFVDKAVNQADLDGAARHFGTRYIQHNPLIADGADGFRHHFQQLRQQFPTLSATVKRIFAEDDFVILHLHAKRTPDDPGLAIVDLFRLDAGKLVEHWEVRQPVAESALHSNGMF